MNIQMCLLLIKITIDTDTDSLQTSSCIRYQLDDVGNHSNDMVIDKNPNERKIIQADESVNRDLP